MNNQITLPWHPINFSFDVGLTGQDHDNYAAQGTFPRYDWMRMVILGLLACQSSNEQPNEYRPGTLWYNLQDLNYKSVFSDTFRDLAYSIHINSADLVRWGEDIKQKQQLVNPTACFSGVCHVESDIISIPASAQSAATTPNRPFVYINGQLINPNLMRFNKGCPVAIELDVILDPLDTFVVFLKP